MSTATMRYGSVPGLDRPVSRLVQGTMMLGTILSEDESFRLLDLGQSLGCNALDTAHIYGLGRCEELVGRWLRARDNRERVVLVGKGAHPAGDRQRVTPDAIAADLGESLVRLQTDYIDIYLLHRDDPAVEVGPIVEALAEQQRAGRIRVYGGSNWTVERIQAANDYAAAHGLPPFAASSPHLSLAEQAEAPWVGTVSIGGAAGAAARAWYARSGVAVLAWSSLAGGFFSGRFAPDRRDGFTAEPDLRCLRCYGTAANFERLARATSLAEDRGLTAAQVAAAWVLHQPLNVFALVGPYAPIEFEANAAACGVSLSAAELAWLNLED